jgi:hypothetical protein
VIHPGVLSDKNQSDDRVVLSGEGRVLGAKVVKKADGRKADFDYVNSRPGTCLIE